MEHILNLEQVKKYYGGNSGNITKAVDGISMYVDKGEFVAIMGASGSGKTTLLNCISTIDTVTSGHITVNNQDITKIKDKDFADFRRENLGFIFQDFNLLDTLTIEENISLSLVINKRRSSKMKQTFKKPSYYLLSQAMDGDEKAIEKILAFYDPYISKCCLRPLYDEYGNVYIVVDMELKGLIREALIKMILGFDIALEIEEE